MQRAYSLSAHRAEEACKSAFTGGGTRRGAPDQSEVTKTDNFLVFFLFPLCRPLETNQDLFHVRSNKVSASSFSASQYVPFLPVSTYLLVRTFSASQYVPFSLISTYLFCQPVRTYLLDRWGQFGRLRMSSQRSSMHAIKNPNFRIMLLSSQAQA